MIAIILPSRGLIFSRTADEILQNIETINREGWKTKIFFSHRKPLPQCFEDPTTEALKDPDVRYLLFVEDDMILKPDTFSEMLSTDKAVVTADYPVNATGMGAVFKVRGEVIYCGTGCLLVKREVFDELRAPYWRTDNVWTLKNYGDFVKITGEYRDGEAYGLHDVNFCMNLYQRDIPIHLIRRKLGQRKLVSLGKAGSNNGAHNIENWTKVEANQFLKEIKSWPVQPTGNLVTVLTPTGEIATSASHAKNLIRKGLATKVRRRNVVIDAGGTA